MKIQLTKEGLKVNKFECKSVTVYKLEDGTFEAHLHDIEGFTKRETRKDIYRQPYLVVTKLKKKIKSKTFEYSGIEMNDSTRIGESQKYLFASNGEKSNYINYYEPKIDVVEKKGDGGSE